jgi:KEOPS complex subunit Cgi121
MLKQLTDYGKYLEINGFRNAKIADPKSFVDTICKEMPKGVEVQLLDACLVASWEHLYFATLNACAAFEAERNASHCLAVEIVRFASARRQIKKAIELIGLKPGTSSVAVLVLGGEATSVDAGLSLVANRFGAKPDESVLELSEEKKKLIRTAFNVSDAELEVVSSKGDRALIDLIIERVALLSTRL